MVSLIPILWCFEWDRCVRKPRKTWFRKLSLDGGEITDERQAGKESQDTTLAQLEPSPDLDRFELAVIIWHLATEGKRSRLFCKLLCGNPWNYSKGRTLLKLHQYVILGSFAILVYFSSRQLYIPTYNCFSLAAEVTNKLCKLTPTSSSITTFDGKVQIYYSGVKSAFCQKRDCFLWLFQMPASSGRLGLWE